MTLQKRPSQAQRDNRFGIVHIPLDSTRTQVYSKSSARDAKSQIPEDRLQACSTVMGPQAVVHTLVNIESGKLVGESLDLPYS